MLEGATSARTAPVGGGALSATWKVGGLWGDFGAKGRELPVGPALQMVEIPELAMDLLPRPFH